MFLLSQKLRPILSDRLKAWALYRLRANIFGPARFKGDGHGSGARRPKSGVKFKKFTVSRKNHARKFMNKRPEMAVPGGRRRRARRRRAGIHQLRPAEIYIAIGLRARERPKVTSRIYSVTALPKR
jgi:hypothetical protein